MHRVGRDNKIPNFDCTIHDENSTLLFCFGEVDCRCYIIKQTKLNKNINDIIHDLVINYVKTIQNAVIKYNEIIIVGVIPPTKQNDYESVNGPITHEFPFIGSDEERVMCTMLINKKLKEECEKYNNFKYFYPYNKYENSDGTLNFSLSDNTVHVKENSQCINELKLLVLGSITECFLEV